MFRRRAKRDRQSLRSCPVCGSGAVGAIDHGDLGGTRTCVELRCAECQTWRQVVVTVWAFDAYERRRARDLDEMQDELTRLEHDRMVAATNAFIAALRRDLVGPTDFTADGAS